MSRNGNGTINDADLACKIVMDAIVTQDLAPSQKVSENIISDKFGISRTIARNLIERLIASHFLVSVSARITQVAPLTLMEVKQNFALRKLNMPESTVLSVSSVDFDELHVINDRIQSLLPIENDTTALELLRANRQFNLAISGRSDLPVLSDWIRQLEDMAMRIYWVYIKINKNFPYSYEHQKEIIEVVRSGESAKIRKAVYDVLDQNEQRIMNTFFSHELFFTQDLMV